MLELATQVASMVLGMKLVDAQSFISERGCISRVIAQDGMQFYFTMDLRGNRVNLEIIDGVVVSARAG